MSPIRSQLTLKVRLPSLKETMVVFEDDQGASWQHSPVGDIGELKSDWCWQEFLDGITERRKYLQRVGVELGDWLFDARAVDFLLSKRRAWTDEEPQLRIELAVPLDRVAWPWELISLPNLGHLSIDSPWTLVRTAGEGYMPAAVGSPLQVEIVGSHLDGAAESTPLATAREIEDIRLAVENAIDRRLVDVNFDPSGDWSALVESYETVGPPHVFHFAGQGRIDGLVFRGADGDGEIVGNDKLSSLLGGRRGDHQTRLAFLNASFTSSGPRALQPFGGLAQRLVSRGVPAVGGFQNPIEDDEARNFAAAFYAGVSRGDAVDCAWQEARRRSFMAPGDTVAWAFAELSVVGEPQPLLDWTHKPSGQPSANLLAFGHENQRQRMGRFLQRRQPTIVIIHGDARSGHRHVAERVHHDLKREGRDVWLPVPTLHWFVVGEPRVSRQQLAGGIARALNLAETGSQEELERRIATELVERCRGDRVFVLDLEKPLSLADDGEADGLIVLVQELWSDLMEAAGQLCASLPIYLILSVAYPVPVNRDPRVLARAERQAQLTAQTIERIAAKRHLKGQVRVEVLRRLEPFSVKYVAEFLEDVFDLEWDDAERRAQYLVGLDDNETILERMARFIEDWRMYE